MGGGGGDLGVLGKGSGGRGDVGVLGKRVAGGEESVLERGRRDGLPASSGRSRAEAKRRQRAETKDMES